MKGFLLDTLTVQGFRGFDAPLNLDLTAPLTVVYAANGTGKTSLCEAVEWLLLDSVSRLSEEDLRCRFSPPNRPTEIKARLVTEKGSADIGRIPSGAWIEAHKGRQQLKQTDILNRLVPLPKSAVLTGVAETSRRRQWLSSARFFSGERVALLIDNDEEMEEARARIMADLMGTSDLLGYQRKLSTVADNVHKEIPPLDKEIRQLDGEIQALTERGPMDQTAILAEGERSCRRLYEVLGESQPILTLATVEEFRTLVNRAEGLFEELRRSHWAGREAMVTVRYHWRDQPFWAGKLAADRTARTEAEATLRNLEIEAATEKRRQEQVRSIAGLIEDLMPLGTDSSRSVAALLDQDNLIELPIAALDLSSLEGEQRHTEQCLINGAPIAAAEAELAAIRARLAADGFADVEPLSAREQMATAHLAGLRTALEAMAGPVSRLRQQALAVLERLAPDHHQCPTCGHDWADAQALRAAIGDGETSATSALTTMARQVEASEQALAKIRAAREAHLRRRILDTVCNAFREQVSILRMPAGLRPDLDGLTEHLRQIRQILALRRLDDELRVWDQTQWRALPLGQLAQATARDLAMLNANAKRIAEATNEAHERIETAEKRMRSLEALSASFNRAWHLLAGDLPPTDEARQASESEVTAREQALTEADAILAAVRTSLSQLERRDQVTALERKRDAARRQRDVLMAEEKRIRDLAENLDAHRKNFERKQIQALGTVMNGLFARMQANEMFEQIGSGTDDAPLRWRAEAGTESFDPKDHFSQGQRQDMALALFLARARGLGGLFLLDEPVMHLDDLNRASLLDTLRMIALEGRGDIRLVVTTASRLVVDHLVEKCQRVLHSGDQQPFLRQHTLAGNPRLGTTLVETRSFGH